MKTVTERAVMYLFNINREGIADFILSFGSLYVYQAE
jgi:hypothetical protein